MDELGISNGALLALAVLIGFAIVAFWRELLLALVAAVLGVLALGLLDVVLWAGGRL